jgi:hypothetical protein
VETSHLTVPPAVAACRPQCKSSVQAFKAPSSSAASRTAFHVVAQKRVQKKAQVRLLLGWLSRPKRSAVWSAIQCYGHCMAVVTSALRRWC